jgi:hypothetical protein
MNLLLIIADCFKDHMGSRLYYSKTLIDPDLKTGDVCRNNLKIFKFLSLNDIIIEIIVVFLNAFR